MIDFTDMSEAAVGLIPAFLIGDDDRDAVAQLDARYAHGGGWHDFAGLRLEGWPEAARLVYPASEPHETDEVYRELSRGVLRSETIIVFDHSWVAVVQPDGSYRVARMD